MSRQTIIYCVLTVVLLAYIIVAVSFTSAGERADTFNGLQICIDDTTGNGFVTSADIDIELGDLSKTIKKTKHSKLNTLELENKLRSLDKIEEAHCVILNNGVLQIDIVPMQPVARVFDGFQSYYINNRGKRIKADARYHVDVPIVSGHFASGEDVAELLPMFDFIRRNPEYDALVTEVTKNKRGDIIVVPSVVGHVINIGDTTMIADKFSRLRHFYHDVMKVKGWDFYDTLSVKWRGRLVATRRTKKVIDDRPLTELDGIVDEVLDNGTMLTTTNGDDSQSTPQSSPQRPNT
jgi:cell division protein FtsQ